MNRKLVFGCLVPIGLVGALAIWGVRSALHADPVPEHTVLVDRGDVEIKVTENGTIEALKKVEIKSKDAGRVMRLLAQEGDRVQAGQLLAVIDPIDINSQVEQMRAQLDGARAHYVQSLRAVTYQKDQTLNGVRQAEEGLRSAQVHYREATEDASTQPSLSQSDVDQAQATLKVAQANLDLLNDSTHPQAVVAA